MTEKMSRTTIATLLAAWLLSACVQSSEVAPSIATEETIAQGTYSAADEAEYLARFQALLASFAKGGLVSYDPLANVKGADDYEALPAGSLPDGAEGQIRAALDYAEARNTEALLIYKDGQLVFEKYFGDTTKDTLINSRSLAKPLGVIAVGRAITTGAMADIETPVAEYLPQWAGTPKSAITVEHLLAMRSGLMPQDIAREPTDIINRAYLHPRHDEVIINDYPLTHTPGSRYEYSNANSELVAPVIERATGVQYEDWVSREVLQQIGAKGGKVWMNREGGTAHSGCCILLPAESWLRLAVLVLDEGRWNDKQIIAPEFIAQMRTPTPHNPHAGMGLYVGSPYLEYRGFLNPSAPDSLKVYHSEPYVDDRMVLFDGNGNQVAYIMPSFNMVILRLGERPPRDLPWDNAFLPNTIAGAFARE